MLKLAAAAAAAAAHPSKSRRGGLMLEGITYSTRAMRPNTFCRQQQKQQQLIGRYKAGPVESSSTDTTAAAISIAAGVQQEPGFSSPLPGQW
jgi:hypothetical protein